VWDVVTGEELGQFEGHQNAVLTIAFAPDGKSFATGSQDGNVLVWDRAALRPGPKPAADLPDKEVQARWDALAGDAAKAFVTINALAAAPQQALPLLKDRLKPVPGPDPARVQQWIADLDNANFARREQATEQLRKLGARVTPALQKALDENPPKEARRRLEILLEQTAAGEELGAEELRSVRAVEVLERLGTAAAKDVLQALADGAPGAPTTTAAQAALERLGR
jgi:hypothetical protein